MTNKPEVSKNRRQFIQSTAAATALGSMVIPHVHAKESNINTVQLALVGCGGRGTGAAADALYASAEKIYPVPMPGVNTEQEYVYEPKA